MPNNQDDVKLRACTCHPDDATTPCAQKFAASQCMNTPTPREQELEAQNKALWESVGECEKALKAAETKFERLNNFPPPEFCFTLVAIQKAKKA